MADQDKYVLQINNELERLIDYLKEVESINQSTNNVLKYQADHLEKITSFYKNDKALSKQIELNVTNKLNKSLEKQLDLIQKQTIARVNQVKTVEAERLKTRNFYNAEERKQKEKELKASDAYRARQEKIRVTEILNTYPKIRAEAGKGNQWELQKELKMLRETLSNTTFEFGNDSRLLKRIAEIEKLQAKSVTTTTMASSKIVKPLSYGKRVAKIEDELTSENAKDKSRELKMIIQEMRDRNEYGSVLNKAKRLRDTINKSLLSEEDLIEMEELNPQKNGLSVIDKIIGSVSRSKSDIANDIAGIRNRINYKGNIDFEKELALVNGLIDEATENNYQTILGQAEALKRDLKKRHSNSKTEKDYAKELDKIDNDILNGRDFTQSIIDTANLVDILEEKGLWKLATRAKKANLRAYDAQKKAGQAPPGDFDTQANGLVIYTGDMYDTSKMQMDHRGEYHKIKRTFNREKYNSAGLEELKASTLRTVENIKNDLEKSNVKFNKDIFLETLESFERTVNNFSIKEKQEKQIKPEKEENIRSKILAEYEKLKYFAKDKGMDRTYAKLVELHNEAVTSGEYGLANKLKQKKELAEAGKLNLDTFGEIKDAKDQSYSDKLAQLMFELNNANFEEIYYKAEKIESEARQSGKSAFANKVLSFMDTITKPEDAEVNDYRKKLQEIIFNLKESNVEETYAQLEDLSNLIKSEDIVDYGLLNKISNIQDGLTEPGNAKITKKKAEDTASKIRKDLNHVLNPYRGYDIEVVLDELLRLEHRADELDEIGLSSKINDKIAEIQNMKEMKGELTEEDRKYFASDLLSKADIDAIEAEAEIGNLEGTQLEGDYVRRKHKIGYNGRVSKNQMIIDQILGGKLNKLANEYNEKANELADRRQAENSEYRTNKNLLFWKKEAGQLSDTEYDSERIKLADEEKKNKNKYNEELFELDKEYEEKRNQILHGPLSNLKNMITKTAQVMKKLVEEIKKVHNTLISASSYRGRTGKDNTGSDTMLANKLYNEFNVAWGRFKTSLGSVFNMSLAGLNKLGAIILDIDAVLMEYIYKPILKFKFGGLIDTDLITKSSEELTSEFTDLSSGLDNAVKSLQVFTDAVDNGQGLISKSNMVNTASEIATAMAKDQYLSNGYTSDQILTMLASALNGNGGQVLGIHTDSATLAGWAAMTQGKDIVNVDITEEKKQQMILDMINEQYKEMAKNGKGSLQSMVKEWKTLGNIMEKTKNQTLAFDEVINLAAFDPEIPDYVSEYNAIGNLTEGIDWANGKLITFGSNGEIVYRDLNEWLLEAGNSIDQVTFGLDENGNAVMMTNDVYRSFKSEVDGLVDIVGTGMEGLTKMLGEQAAAYIKNSENINTLNESIDTMKAKLLEKLGIDIDTFEAETGLNKVLMIVDGIKTKFEELKKLVTDTWNEIKTFISGSFNSEDGLLNKLGNSVFAGGLINNLTPGDSDSVKLGRYIGEGIAGVSSNIGDWVYEQWYGHPKDFSQWDHTSDTSSNYVEDKWYNRLVQGLTQFSFIDAPLWGMQNYDTSAFHASGGISTKAHLAHISEMNKAEAIIPLESSIGINALSEAMNKAGAEGLSQGNTYNIHLHLDGINIADNDNQWSEVANRIAEYMQININRQGEYNYGLV